MHRYALRDDQWDKIKDFLPGREGHVGGTAADNRLFVDAVIYRYRTGIPWRDLPERYGHWKAVHRRYRRWCKSGVFMQVFEIMSGDADDEFVMRDATSCAPISIVPAPKKRRRGPSDRPLTWRTDDENPHGRRCARQSSRALAHSRAGSM